jgi:Zn-dependent peptidase ImmA (M78 family)
VSEARCLLAVESLCERVFGIKKVVTEQLAFEGGVFQEGNHLVIKLNAPSPYTRRRFTLAHELGHLLIETGSPVNARRHVLSSTLETACDAIAAELLMPLQEIQLSGASQPSVENLLKLAHRFGVSLQALANRIAQQRIWKCSVGMWKYQQNTATELWVAGKRPWLTRKPHVLAFELAAKTADAIARSEQIYDGPGVHPVFLKVRKIGEQYLLAPIFS